MGKRTIGLDLVRILAMGMVLAVHVGQLFGAIDPYTTIGAKGVQLFFVLSGYLAMVSLGRDGNVKRFYTKRLVRIIPAYYCCLCVIWIWDVVKYLLIQGNTLAEVFSIEGPCGIRFLRYFTFMHMVVPSSNYGLWCNRYALWTMSSFMFFYLIMPLLYKCIKTFRRGMCILVVLLVTRPWLIGAIAQLLNSMPAESHIEWFSYQNPICEFYCFFFGVVLYLAQQEKKDWLYVVALLVGSILTKFEYFSYEIGFVILIFLAVSNEIEIKNTYAINAIKFISGASFAVYLVHPLLINVITTLRIGWFYRLPQIIGFGMIFFCLLGIALVIWWKFFGPIEENVKKGLRIV